MIDIDCLVVAFQDKWTSGKAPEFHLVLLVPGFSTDPCIVRYNSVYTIKFFGQLKNYIFNHQKMLILLLSGKV